ncbi:hypothetical protein EK21DRAFT_117952 [Setomelanomma holmii]|uniref:Uncharacterized protein n=1 Tax=Setomelanomma holmii TaxID=210430 RepID=A0A9P4GYF1_9PLEO|nr:hypothetical protein EK21DRAFT_117952 [Setomelanomma holmii]
MSPLSRIASFILILHGLINLFHGIYTFVSPTGYIAATGTMFTGSPDKAVQAIGMGAIGIGLYQVVFAYQGNRALILATLLMRLGFMGVMAQWGNTGAVVTRRKTNSLQKVH